MAKIGEIFASIFGIDPNKDYEINIPKEEPVTAQVQVVDQQPPQVVQEPIQQTANIEQPIDYKSLYEKQQAEIQSLKEANHALLTQTPVSNPELKLEDLIYRAVIGEPQ